MTTITAEERAYLRDRATENPRCCISGEDVLRLLDALDAAERRSAPLVWRALTAEAIEALPAVSWFWLRHGSGPAGIVRAPYALDIAVCGRIPAHPVGPHDEWQIAGPIPEPMEGERT